MRGKRIAFAAGLFAVTLIALLTATGVAMASDQPGTMRGDFRIAEPRPGDRAVYALYLLVEMPYLDQVAEAMGQESNGDRQALFIDGGARFVVQRHEDRALPTGDGGTAVTASYTSEWSTEPFAWGAAAWSDWSYEGDVEGDWDFDNGDDGGEAAQFAAEPWSVVHTVGPAVVAQTLPHDRVAGDFPGRVLASDLGLEARGTVTSFAYAPAPCGFHSDLQGTERSLARPIHVSGQCPPAASLFGFAPNQASGVDVLASGRDTWGQEEAVVFAHVDGASKLRLWFTESVPYPVRLLSQAYEVDENLKFHVLYELVEFAPGQVHDPAIPALATLQAPRAAFGPDEANVQHPFPLSAAWTAAAQDADVAAWLADHPQAQADSARFLHWEEGDATEERWTFVANDGPSALEVRVTQRTAPPGNGTVPSIPLLPPIPTQPETTVSVTSRSVSADGRLPPSLMPSTLPGVAPLAQRWQVAGAPAPDPGAWAFRLCSDCSQGFVAAGQADAIEGAFTWGFLGLRPDGTPLFIEESDGPFQPPAPRSPDDYGAFSLDTDDEDWEDPRSFTLSGAGMFGVWSFPEPATAAKVSFVAALLGVLAYAFSPLLKGLAPGAAGVGLFSRIGPDEVMEHPLRQQIVQLVEAEPGLHFQEIARRLDTGRGTLEHHLRKLVAAEVVSAQASQGFTCYFPKGKVDRRLMAAAPVLKSDGARLVLQAIANSPGRAAQDIAATTGLTPSTVNYHLKRLSAVGLVETVRSGRFTLLTTTAIGQQAIATWTGT